MMMLWGACAKRHCKSWQTQKMYSCHDFYKQKSPAYLSIVKRLGWN